MVGSGLFWPDLGLSRIAAITPSTGDRPVRQEGSTADIFRITLDPGTVITFVAELRSDKLPQIYLWEPDAYKDKVNSLHALLRHRHRHRRSARAVSHDPLRRQGLDHVSGRRRTRLGGSHLYRHRLRLLGQGIRHVGGRGARMARLRRGHPVGDAAGFSLRLSQSRRAGTCVTRTSRSPGWRHLPRWSPSRVFDPAVACRHRADVARGHRGVWASRLSSIFRRTASIARCC